MILARTTISLTFSPTTIAAQEPTLIPEGMYFYVIKDEVVSIFATLYY